MHWPSYLNKLVYLLREAMGVSALSCLVYL